MLKEKGELVMMVLSLLVFIILVVYLFNQDAALVGPI
jgi:hypothetical protein